MNPTILLWPLIIHALVTLFLYIPMSNSRVRTVKEGGVKSSVYKLNQGEPEESLRFSNAIRNQNEIGLLFYAATLVAYVTDNVSFVTAALVWLFVIIKTIHVYVHVSTNNLRHRRPIFATAYFVLIALWVWNALHLAAIV